MKLFLFVPATIFILSIIGSGQSAKKNSAPSAPPVAVQTNRSTPAFAEILLRKTELESGLEDLLVGYTEEYPKVKETRYELGLINKDLEKILAVNASESSKLTLALGKLLVRRATLETDLWALRAKYGEENADVKRASRKVSVFDKAIKEILPER